MGLGISFFIVSLISFFLGEWGSRIEHGPSMFYFFAILSILLFVIIQFKKPLGFNPWYLTPIVLVANFRLVELLLMIGIWTFGSGFAP